MSEIETSYDKWNPYISEIVDSADSTNILIDKLIVILIKMHNEDTDYNEVNHFIKVCITLSSKSIDDVFNWLKENQNESKYVFLLGFFYYNKFNLEENNISEGFVFFL